MAVGAKRKREYRAHFLDASMTPTTGYAAMNLVRIGVDNDSLSRSITYDTENFKNVFGEQNVDSTRGLDELDVNPYYVRKDEPLGMLLEKIDVEELELDDIKRVYVEAAGSKEEWEADSVPAFAQIADVKPSEAGGPSSNADMTAFGLSLSGEKTKGMFTPSTMTFVAAV